MIKTYKAGEVIVRTSNRDFTAPVDGTYEVSSDRIKLVAQSRKFTKEDIGKRVSAFDPAYRDRPYIGTILCTTEEGIVVNTDEGTFAFYHSEVTLLEEDNYLQYPLGTPKHMEEALREAMVYGQSSRLMKHPVSHKGHTIIRNQANGESFRVCTKCKVEVNEQGDEL